MWRYVESARRGVEAESLHEPMGELHLLVGVVRGVEEGRLVGDVREDLLGEGLETGDQILEESFGLGRAQVGLEEIE
jgi:hypothetical protein